MLTQSRRDAEAAQSQADDLEHMSLQWQRRCEELEQKSVAVAQQREYLEHVLLQASARSGFEEERPDNFHKMS